MKTTLDLPADLVADACAVLGVTSASRAVELALLEVVRRGRAAELKALLGRIQFEFDPGELRHRERAATVELDTADVNLPQAPVTRRPRRRQRRPKA
jgi:Arc/MetJ family transcription regulator